MAIAIDQERQSRRLQQILCAPPLHSADSQVHFSLKTGHLAFIEFRPFEQTTFQEFPDYRAALCSLENCFDPQTRMILEACAQQAQSAGLTLLARHNSTESLQQALNAFQELGLEAGFVRATPFSPHNILEMESRSKTTDHQVSNARVSRLKFFRNWLGRTFPMTALNNQPEARAYWHILCQDIIEQMALSLMRQELNSFTQESLKTLLPPTLHNCERLVDTSHHLLGIDTVQMAPRAEAVRKRDKFLGASSLYLNPNEPEHKKILDEIDKELEALILS